MATFADRMRHPLIVSITNTVTEICKKRLFMRFGNPFIAHRRIVFATYVTKTIGIVLTFGQFTGHLGIFEIQYSHRPTTWSKIGNRIVYNIDSFNVRTTVKMNQLWGKFTWCVIAHNGRLLYLKKRIFNFPYVGITFLFIFFRFTNFLIFVFLWKPWICRETISSANTYTISNAWQLANCHRNVYKCVWSIDHF